MKDALIVASVACLFLVLGWGGWVALNAAVAGLLP